MFFVNFIQGLHFIYLVSVILCDFFCILCCCISEDQRKTSDHFLAANGDPVKKNKAGQLTGTQPWTSRFYTHHPLQPPPHNFCVLKAGSNDISKKHSIDKHFSHRHSCCDELHYNCRVACFLTSRRSHGLVFTRWIHMSHEKIRI